MKSILFVLALSAVVFSCAVNNDGTRRPDRSASGPRSYTVDDFSIQAVVGEEFVLVLDSNPSTGYSWRLAEPLDAGILDIVDTRYERDATRPGMMGSGGNEFWRFRAVGAGGVFVRLEYVRPWESGASPADTATFRVEVR